MVRQVRPGGRPAYTRPSYGRPMPRRRRLGSAVPSSVRRLLLLMAVVVAGAGLVRYLTRVSVISVQGTTRTVEVRTNTEHSLHQHWLWQSLVTLDASGLSKQIMQNDPQLKEVSVGRRWPQGIIVTVSDKRPSLVWDTGGERYLIDADGTTIARIGDSAAGLPLVRDQTNLPTAPGQQVVTAHFVDFVTILVGTLPRQGIKVQALEIHETTYDLYATTDKNYQIIFDTTRDAADELADLKTVETTLATQKAVPAAYIDLRVPGKAYYK